MYWVLIIVGILFIAGAFVALMYYAPPGSRNTLNQVEDIKTKFNPNDTRFRASSKSVTARKQGELLAEINNVNSHLVASIVIQTEAVKANERLMNANYDYLLEREKIDEDHRAYVALSQNKVMVAKLASEYGTTPQIMGKLILLKARTETDEKAKDREMEREIEKHRRMKEIDFEFENKMASLDTQMAEIEHLLPQHLINALNRQLSTIHFEYEQVKQLENGEFREREIKRVERNMKALEKNIREREKNI